MKTLLELLDPPCPQDALGELLPGFDFDNPVIPELAAMLERFRLWKEGDVELTSLIRWGNLRREALGNIHRIDSVRVPSAVLLAWIQASEVWTALARSDFRRALGLYKPTAFIDTAMPCEAAFQISDDFEESDARASVEGTWAAEPQTNPDLDAIDALNKEGLCGGFEGVWSPCPAGEVTKEMLRASDGVLAVWTPFREDWVLRDRQRDLAPPGDPLLARLMQEGELCESNNNFAKYYRNDLWHVVGNHWAPTPVLELSDTQRGYLETFIGADSGDWPRTWEPAAAQGEEQMIRLTPIGGSGNEEAALCIIRRPSEAGWASRGNYLNSRLHVAARQAGWSEQEGRNSRLFLRALRLETLSREFRFYHSFMIPWNARCAQAPSDADIIAALRELRSAAHSTQNTESLHENIESFHEQMRNELRRIREELTILRGMGS